MRVPSKIAKSEPPMVLFEPKADFLIGFNKFLKNGMYFERVAPMFEA